MKKQKDLAQAFTIIEVMIVVAIAGIILMIVFLFVPTVKMTYRNRARSAEAARILALVSDYYNSNNHTPPPDCHDAVNCPFLGNTKFIAFDPSKFVFETSVPAAVHGYDYVTYNPDKLDIIFGAVCSVGIRGPDDIDATNVAHGDDPSHSTAAVFQFEGRGGPGQYDYTSPDWNPKLRKCIDLPI